MKKDRASKPVQVKTASGTVLGARPVPPSGYFVRNGASFWPFGLKHVERAAN
jgi:hypothetical protein